MKPILVRLLIVFAIVCAAVFIFLTLGGCASFTREEHSINEVNQQPGIAALIGTINAEMKAKKITGLSIAVADSNGVLWTEGFGAASKEKGIPFSTETVSNVGSVAKLITAAAIMRLVEMKAIDLDAPVSAYIPEFNPSGLLTDNPITVRMLLNHESGLESDGFRGFYLGYEPPEDYPVSYRSVLEVVNQSGVVREPYEVFSYCNLGYSLLGIIIERAQGGDFQTAVKELVFDPIGMDDSTFNILEVPEDRMATGYIAGKPQSVPYIRDMPAGSLNSSAEDMGLFLQSMLVSYRSDDGLLASETMKEMFTPSNSGVAADLDFRVGVTWWVVDFKKLPGEFIVAHGGDLPPFHAMALVLPERDLSVFIMVNSVDGVGAFSLADIVEKSVRTFAKLKGQSPIAGALVESPVAEIPAGIKSDLAGYYASSLGLAEIKVSGDKLKMYAFNQWLDAYYHADNTLTLGVKILGIIPLEMPVFDELSVSLEDIEGSPAINLRLQGILISPAIKIEPVHIDPTWLERCGEYEAAGSEIMPAYTDFKIEVDKKSGFLCLYTKSGGEWTKFPLETKDSSAAQLMGIGRGLEGFIRAVSGETGEVLMYQNFELSKK
jgi:CubicO group peptidase (beta-lactamase class C family)